LSFWAKRRI